MNFFIYICLEDTPSVAPNQLASYRPEYDPLQRAFHVAFRPELTRLIRRLPLPAQPAMLDVPCGDGFYARRLARHVIAGGRFVAVDADAAYVAAAQKQLSTLSGNISVVQGDAYCLGLADETFDLIWCGQSFITLEDHLRAITEFKRVTRSGGRIVIYETDAYHHMLLTWPVGLEVAIMTALAHAAREKYGKAGRIAAVRSVGRTMQMAGLNRVRRRTIAMDREAPFDSATTHFLALHFAHLREMVFSRLDSGRQNEFDRFTKSDSQESFLRSHTVEFTCLTTIHVGTKS